jgi:hypothetical protein
VIAPTKRNPHHGASGAKSKNKIMPVIAVCSQRVGDGYLKNESTFMVIFEPATRSPNFKSAVIHSSGFTLQSPQLKRARVVRTERRTNRTLMGWSFMLLVYLMGLPLLKRSSRSQTKRDHFFEF